MNKDTRTVRITPPNIDNPPIPLAPSPSGYYDTIYEEELGELGRTFFGSSGVFAAKLELLLSIQNLAAVLLGRQLICRHYTFLNPN